MGIAFSVIIDEDHSVDMTRQTRRDIQKQTYLAIGNRWQTKWLPRHFTRRAHDIYGYRQRSKKWIARKEREAKTGRAKKGGRVDIVYRGTAETLFSKSHVVRAYPTRATINMHGPRYITMRPRKANVFAIGPEILKVVSEELADLDRVGQETMEKLIKLAPPRRRRIKGRKS